MSPWLVAGLVILGLCLWVLFSTLCYLLLLDIRSRRDLGRRARHDYRAARGTQHLRLIQEALPALERDLQAHRKHLSDLQAQIERLQTDYAKALCRALSQTLIETRLTEVDGIGPTLRDRILRDCFRDSIADLHRADRVRGIGSTLQQALSAWVNGYLDEFPRLISEGFPGKGRIAGEYNWRVASLSGQRAAETETAEHLEGLQRQARATIEKLGTVKLRHFLHALRQDKKGEVVPSWYLAGVYPAWKPMPGWFETLLQEYGG
jgi:hypothetical protein